MHILAVEERVVMKNLQPLCRQLYHFRQPTPFPVWTFKIFVFIFNHCEILSNICLSDISVSTGISSSNFMDQKQHVFPHYID